MEKDGGSTQLTDNIGYQNLLGGAQVLRGQTMIVKQPERPVTTETGEEEFLVPSRFISRTVFKDGQVPINLAALKNYEAQTSLKSVIICLRQK